MNQSGGAGTFTVAARLVSERLCVVYDVGSGGIRHTHRVVTFEGGTEPSLDEIATDARSFAARRARPDDSLDVLHVEAHAVEFGRTYKVDGETRRLVAQ